MPQTPQKSKLRAAGRTPTTSSSKGLDELSDPAAPIHSEYPRVQLLTPTPTPRKRKRVESEDELAMVVEAGSSDESPAKRGPRIRYSAPDHLSDHGDKGESESEVDEDDEEIAADDKPLSHRGLGSLMENRFDWLADDRTSDYARWRAKIMRRIETPDQMRSIVRVAG